MPTDLSFDSETVIQASEFVELAGQARLSDQPLPIAARTLSAVPVEQSYRLQHSLSDWFQAHGTGSCVHAERQPLAHLQQRSG